MDENLYQEILVSFFGIQVLECGLFPFLSSDRTLWRILYFLVGLWLFLKKEMARVRASGMVAVTTAMAVTGASLAYVYFTRAPEPAPHPPPQAMSLPPPNLRHFSPPPDLPLSSKLPVIPDSNFDDLEVEDAYDCDYGPLWECIVNGNGGCEVLEEDLRNCLEKSRKSRRS